MEGGGLEKIRYLRMHAIESGKTCRNTKRDVEPAFMGPLKNLKCLPVDWTEYCTLYTMCSSPSVQIPATQIATSWESMVRAQTVRRRSGGPHSSIPERPVGEAEVRDMRFGTASRCPAMLDL